MKLICTILVSALILSACGDAKSDGGTDGGNRTLVGIVTDVEATSLTDVTSFTLRSEGETIEIKIARSIVYSFPPEHLRSHAIASDPVRVEVEVTGGELVALSLEDA